MSAKWERPSTLRARLLDRAAQWWERRSAEQHFRYLKERVTLYAEDLRPRLVSANAYLTHLGLKPVMADGDFGLPRCLLTWGVNSSTWPNNLEQAYMRLLDCLDAVDYECELAISRLPDPSRIRPA